MKLLWPWFLPLLLIIPLLIAVYLWILRRRRRYAVRYSTLSIIREALPKRARWRQHLPFALFLVGLTFLIVATTRPAAQVKVPLNRTTIILAIDVSRSMCAVDVPPNRLTVAQEAASAFIEDQADGTRIGIVAFAGFAEIIVPPTNDKEALLGALDNLTTSLGTAIGSATLKSIDALAAINEAVAPSGLNLRAGEPGAAPAEAPYQPDIIVLLTDGANSQGPLPLDAARQAADRQVRVYTIGFGTTDPRQMACTRAQLGSDAFRDGNFGGGGFRGGGFGGNFGGDPFGGPGGGGFRRFLVIDEPTLRAVADLTGGDYFRAENADQLHEVFLDLPTQIVLQNESLEISVIFTALGAFFALLAVGLSLWWNRFP
jgi:Ca-activated chloride channel family protein